MILARTWPSCLYLLTWFVSVLLKITLKGRLVHWKCLWSMFVIWFLNITRKSRNFHAFTLAYLAHAQTNFPAATEICLLSLKVLHEHKMKLPLDIVSKHVLLSVLRSDYIIKAMIFTCPVISFVSAWNPYTMLYMIIINYSPKTKWLFLNSEKIFKKLFAHFR